MELKPVLEDEPEDLEALAREAARPSPEVRAGPVSSVLFGWVTAMFTFAKRKRKREGLELEQEDLWDLPPWDNTEGISDKFARGWDRRRSGKLGTADSDTLLASSQASSVLTGALWSVIRWRMIMAGFAKLINSALQFTYPIMINQILQYIQSLGTPLELPQWRGYGIAVIFGTVMILKAGTENIYFFLAARSGWQVRSIVTTEVYRKALRLSPSARQSMTTGQIVNLMQLDSTKLEQFVATSFHVLWDGIFQIFGYMAILYVYIGEAAFVGLAVMLVAIPVQLVIFSRTTRVNRKMVKVTDNRVKLTNEVLQGVLGIKMAAWEEKYATVIEGFRKQELRHLRSIAWLSSSSLAFMFAMPAVTAVAALSFYAFQRDGAIDAATLFAALSAFGQLRFPLMFYPQALAVLSQARVSRKRVADFFALDEISSAGGLEDAAAAHNAQGPAGDIAAPRRRSSGSSSTSSKSAKPAVLVQNGQFYWARPDAEQPEVSENKNKNKNKGAKGATRPDLDAGDAADPPQNQGPVLDNVDVQVAKGSLVGIVGPVGAGKTSLLNAMLGEMHKTRGRVEVNGTVAYASQTAWIFNDTVRANILFGEPMDEPRYRKVLKVCQLAHDLKVLQDGDMTMIGERGINLSGGQKQRISVARAAYSRKEIVILDDPLSALDPEVARRIFDECVIKFLADRTRVLVTNGLNFLPRCDSVVVLESTRDGPSVVAEQGRYSVLLRSGLDFSKLMAKYNGGSGEGEGEGEDSTSRPSSGLSAHSGDMAAAAAAEESIDSKEAQDERTRRMSSAIADAALSEAIHAQEGKELMQIEERQQGAVRLGEYVGYFKAGGGLCLASFVLLVFLFNQGITVGNQAWVAVWAEDEQYDLFSFQFYVLVYAVSALLIAAVTFVRSLMVFFFSLRASRKLHSNLVASIMQAPMSFFDTTPIGRVVSRFSKDLFLIDTQLAFVFSFFVFSTTFVLFTIGTIGFSTPWFLVAVPFLTFLYVRFLNYYRPLSRDCKRLESISRSPVYAHFSETLGGLATIRAFDQADVFRHTNEAKVDNNMQAWYLLKAVERWLAVRLEIMGAVITVLAAVLAVFSAEEGLLEAGFAGLSLTFATSITGLLNGTVRSFAELEAAMNSVERLLHYSRDIEQEAPFRSQSPPPKDWPSAGTIELTDLRMRYRKDTPLVLKGVTLRIEGGQRVGVCGRTGSGKSSLLLSLLRLVEPVVEEGDAPPIVVDGVDVSKIGLHELRSNISIVPQSPSIFSGTIRSNLDPFGQYTDDQLWAALDQSAMRVPIEEAGGLDSEVSESGENFSQGQRQLLCLARSILMQAKVLLLDEATSSVDYETDVAIQNTIRTAFSDCTIITIAHRLNTVIDSDKILVLDNGEVAEFDAPSSLLARPTSVFSSMVSELGPAMAAKLRSAAR